jgi:hypothetical protein
MPNVEVTGRRRQDGSARAGETVPRTTGAGAGGLPLALRLTDELGVTLARHAHYTSHAECNDARQETNMLWPANPF